jgi:hypothetical protein
MALAASALCTLGLAAHATEAVRELQDNAASPASAAPAAPPAADATPAATWRIDGTDHSLRSLFARWSQTAGWQLAWELPVDYELRATAQLSGRFEDVVGAVVDSMDKTDAPMKAIFYRGNKVLRVVAKGVQ